MIEPRVLFSWIGQTDLNASDPKASGNLGPLAETLAARDFERVVLLSNYSKQETTHYVKWLKSRTSVVPEVHQVTLSSPMNYSEIYQTVVDRIGAVVSEAGASARLHCLLSPGTSAMAAIWIIVSKTRHPAVLLQSSREQGVEEAEIPFNLAAEFLPQLYQGLDENLTRLSTGE